MGSDIDRLLRMDAARTGRLQQRRQFRPIHLQPAPLVIVPFSLTGESSSLWAVAIGTSRTERDVFVCADPRVPALHARMFHRFTRLVRRHLESGHFYAVDQVESARGKVRQVAVRTPQFVFPNRAAANLVLGAAPDRFRRFRWQQSVLEDSPDRENLHEIRNSATFLERVGVLGDLAGSSIVTTAVDLVRSVYTTGLAEYEEQHLGMLTEWAATGDRRAAWVAERSVQPGPGLDPRIDSWANETIISQLPDLPAEGGVNPGWVTRVEACRSQQATVDLFTAILDGTGPAATTVAGLLDVPQLRGVWDAMWDAIDLARTIPEAPYATTLNEEERYLWASLAVAHSSGSTLYPIRGLRSTSRHASTAGDRASLLEAREAIDDRLVQAGLVADGKAIAGTVTAVTPVEQQRSSNTYEIEIAAIVAPRIPAGSTLWLTSFPRESWKAEILSVEPATPSEPCRVVLQYVTSRRKDTPSVEGLVGRHVVFTAYNDTDGKGRGAPAPTEEPWLHTKTGHGTGAAN